MSDNISGHWSKSKNVARRLFFFIYFSLGCKKPFVDNWNGSRAIATESLGLKLRNNIEILGSLILLSTMFRRSIFPLRSHCQRWFEVQYCPWSYCKRIVLDLIVNSGLRFNILLDLISTSLEVKLTHRRHLMIRYLCFLGEGRRFSRSASWPRQPWWSLFPIPPSRRFPREGKGPGRHPFSRDQILRSKRIHQSKEYLLSKHDFFIKLSPLRLY